MVFAGLEDSYGEPDWIEFSADVKLFGSWGAHGHGQGAFINPHAIWVRGEGRVLVVDRGNNRVQVFTPEGVWLEEWTGFSQPLGIWADDNVFVTDLVPSLSMFSKAGKLLGRCRPALNGAHGVTGDSSGNIYLAEGNPSRVTRLRRVRS